MWNKPPLLFVIAAMIMVVYANYTFYQIWFEPKKLLNSVKKTVYKLPSWYPLRGLHTVMVSDDKGWITFNKIMSILMEIFLIAWLTIILIAWFIGK
jgi:hypothetical protein